MRDRVEQIVEIHDTSAGVVTEQTTEAGIPGVITVGAWYDHDTRTISILVGKVVSPDSLLTDTLERLKITGAPTMGEASRAMRQKCGGR